jgi:hypothetical protein
MGVKMGIDMGTDWVHKWVVGKMTTQTEGTMAKDIIDMTDQEFAAYEAEQSAKRALEWGHLTTRARLADAVTDGDIQALRAEAGSAGDLDQVALCDRALAGDVDARLVCIDVIVDAKMAPTNSETCGASSTGYNVYRFRESGREGDQEFVGSAATLDEALRLARAGDQIQQGLRGEVLNVAGPGSTY